MPEESKSVDFAGLIDGYTTADRYDPTEEDKEIVSKLKEWFTGAHDSKQYYERDWELYRLYLKGDQLVVRHKDTGEIVRLTAEDSKRLRSVNNVLRPTARSLVGKLTRTIPTCTVLPATSDFEEQHGARAASGFLQYLRRKENLDVKYLDVNNKLPWAGNSFMQVSWDYAGGEDISYCEICDYYEYEHDSVDEECPQCAAQKEAEAAMMAETQSAIATAQMQDVAAGASAHPIPLPSPDSMQLGPLPLDAPTPPLIAANEGDIKVRVRDPRDVFIDPGAESLEQAQVVCLREVVSVAQARARFPDFGNIIKSEGDIQSDHTAQARYNSTDTYGNSESLDDHCYIYEFHERKTPQYPKGRCIFMINDTIVREMESPYYMFNRFPIFHFMFDKNDGEFWGEPFLAQSWHRQREINQVETQIREHVELLLRPKFFKAIGSRITADELTATSAQVVTYNAAAGRNYFESPPPIPQDVFRRNAQLAADIRQQAAVTDQEAGITMSDPNGRAMAIIEAEADQQVGPVIMRNNSEWREMHRCALMLVQSYYHPDRKFTVIGPDGMQTYSFDAIRLSPGFDIQLEQEDGLSRNPAVRLTQAMDLLNAGVFTDMQTGAPDMKAFMRHAKLKLPQSGYDAESTERAVASRVPYLIENGEQHIPSVEDDPFIFAEELLGWLRGPGRRSSDEVKGMVREIWMFYTAWASQGIPPAEVDGMQGVPNTAGAGPGGPDQSAPGGTMNRPGRIQEPGRGGSIGQEAGQQVGIADRQAERAARVTSEREG
tara:strand:+ start:183 stop:2501 length:2319 start_codon:yes stop_codon:yes gene_type:complete